MEHFKGLFIFILTFFFLSSTHLHAYKWELSAAMIFQDEAPYLREWIEYHKMLGVQHFYLYNNKSTDNYLEVLKPYIRSKEVELTEWNFSFEEHETYLWTQIQCNAYRNAHIRCKKNTKWLIILDSDEFFVPVEHESLISLLKNYEDDKTLAAIYGKWVSFGTSHVTKIPDDTLMIELLLMNLGYPDPMHVKGISRPHRVLDYSDPHRVIPRKGYTTVELETDLLQVNHYWTRDEHYFFNFKIPRREKIETSRETCMQWAEDNNGPANKFSLPILRFIPELRSRMGFGL